VKLYTQKLKKWWPLPAAFIASAAFSAAGLIIDQSCRPIGNMFCSMWVKFQWETVLAGGLGLMGGIFVILSTREHIQANREDAVNRELDPVDRLLRVTDRTIKDAQEHIGKARKTLLATPYAESGKVENNWNNIRVDVKGAVSHSNQAQTIAANTDFPRSLRDAAKEIVEKTKPLGEQKYTTTTSPAETLEAIENIANSLIAANEELRSERQAYASILLNR
jgi:hypothetical protein